MNQALKFPHENCTALFFFSIVFFLKITSWYYKCRRSCLKAPLSFSHSLLLSTLFPKLQFILLLFQSSSILFIPSNHLTLPDCWPCSGC